MSTKRRSLAATGAIVVAAFVVSAGAFAAEPATPATPAAPAEPSKQSREQMAAVHEKMAACLRSDKAFAECRTQMQNACHAVMGNQCSMMMDTGMHMRQGVPTQ